MYIRNDATCTTSGLFYRTYSLTSDLPFEGKILSKRRKFNNCHHPIATNAVNPDIHFVP